MRNEYPASGQLPAPTLEDGWGRDLFRGIVEEQFVFGLHSSLWVIKMRQGGHLLPAAFLL